VSKKTKIYIVGEYHPTNLRELAFLCVASVAEEIESLKDKLIEQYQSQKKIDDKLLENIHKNIDKLLECEEVLFCAQEIREKEFEYINKLTSSLNDKIVIYLEGNHEANIGRYEIVELAKRENLKLVYLDEGNVRYEKTMDENGRILKHAYEIQIGREDYWIKRIEETVGDAKYAIAIVGRNHVGRSKESVLNKIYKKFSPKYRHIGYFDKKLKERGYDVEIVEITC